MKPVIRKGGFYRFSAIRKGMFYMRSYSLNHEKHEINHERHERESWNEMNVGTGF